MDRPQQGPSTRYHNTNPADNPTRVFQPHIHVLSTSWVFWASQPCFLNPAAFWPPSNTSQAFWPPLQPLFRTPAGPWQPTKANTGQHRPTAVSRGNRDGPMMRHIVWARYVFFSIFSFIIDILWYRLQPQLCFDPHPHFSSTSWAFWAPSHIFWTQPRFNPHPAISNTSWVFWPPQHYFWHHNQVSNTKKDPRDVNDNFLGYRNVFFILYVF